MARRKQARVTCNTYCRLVPGDVVELLYDQQGRFAYKVRLADSDGGGRQPQASGADPSSPFATVVTHDPFGRPLMARPRLFSPRRPPARGVVLGTSLLPRSSRPLPLLLPLNLSPPHSFTPSLPRLCS